MPTSTPLYFIPHEVLLSIVEYLLPHDLVQLSLACRHLNVLVEPLIWSDVELHEKGYHESQEECSYPPPFILTPKRAYLPGSILRHHGPQYKSEAFFNVLHFYGIRDERRLEHVAARMSSLCTVMHRYLHWSLVPHFTNLRALELHGVYDEGREKAVSAPCIPNLSFLKLSGYVSPQFAAWALGSGRTLERLELGMLGPPVGSTSWSDLEGEAVLPQPLGGFLPAKDDEAHSGRDLDNYQKFDLELPRLKQLHLGRPSLGRYIPFGLGFNYVWSQRADEASLNDWRQLLLASKETLEVLVIEQRPGAEEIEVESWGSETFMRYNRTGIGNGQLVDMLEGVLLEKNAFPALKRVFIYGLAVGQNSTGRPSERVPGGRLMHKLEARNVRCEARLGRWCLFASETGLAKWGRWEKNCELEADTESDTLLAAV